MDADLPPLYKTADKSSLDSQRRFLLATKVRLAGLLGAGAFGLFTIKLGNSPTDWAGVVAALSFTTALIVEIYILNDKPEQTWYEGRAAAESVKTLSWRYSVGGEPFGIGTPRPENEIEALFLRQLDGVLEVLKDLDVTPDGSAAEQISKRMRELRKASLFERQSRYAEDRVVEQQNWYTRKAIWNKKRARSWTIAMLAIEIAGIMAAILKAVGIIEGDVLGFAGVLVASITAWVQAKQHGTLGTAYSVTALELASLRTKINHQHREEDWARFIDDAEEAFSREHTLWKASRGVRSI